jgi:hypothetical protein
LQVDTVAFGNLLSEAAAASLGVDEHMLADAALIMARAPSIWRYPITCNSALPAPRTSHSPRRRPMRLWLVCASMDIPFIAHRHDAVSVAGHSSEADLRLHANKSLLLF